MRTLQLFVAFCLLPVVALAQADTQAPAADPAPAPPSTSSESEAGDVSEVDKDALGPLRERIPPVSGHLFLKKGRFELSPSLTVSARDAFFQKFIFGASFTFFPLETVGVGLRAGYSIPIVSGAAQICNFTEGGDGGVTRGCRAPLFEELDGTAPGQMTLLGGVDVQWAPIYGKQSLLAERFTHFDIYGLAGISVVQYRGPPEGDARSSARMTAGANLGIGSRVFFNRYMTLRTEVRDLIYVEKAVSPSTTLRHQLLLEVGFSFFIPTVLPES